jgi:aldehyde dehydrogenase (NAD+)
MLNILQIQKEFYNNGNTQAANFRITQLKKLLQVIYQNENEIYNALYTDLKKSKEEVWVTELAIVINEIKFQISNLKNWMQPQPVRTNLTNFPSKSYVVHEPLGVVLIIAPWNYPFQLLFNPLVGAMAAGNCVALKGSEHAPATNALMQQIITTTFESNYIHYFNGDGATIVPQLMQNFRFDHVFYTGSTAVGKLIYTMAANQLTPVTLELGGKSPCVVTPSANIKIAAKRIVVSKFSNCGQMCVAPDYVLVHESKKDALIKALIQSIESMYTTDAASCYNYGKIINEKQWNRLVAYLQQGTILYGGNSNKQSLYIQPTIITNVELQSAIMQEEIFGPILPIITYNTPAEAVQIINENPNPLAFYVFAKNDKQKNYWLSRVPFGGGCVNNTAWHLTNHHLPFGGKGNSGIGAYHGKKSFETFSHCKSIMKTPNWFDPSIKYPPLKGKLNIFKWLIK